MVFDYILNKLSGYSLIVDNGEEVDRELVEGPKQIRIAKKFLGLHEVVDNKHLSALLRFNPANTPWCAGFVNAVERMCGRKGTGKMLARSYLKYGEAVTVPRLGDIVVFQRGNSSWQGHVGYYISERDQQILTLGGNQNNKVCYKFYPGYKVLGYRRPE